MQVYVTWRVHHILWGSLQVLYGHNWGNCHELCRWLITRWHRFPVFDHHNPSPPSLSWHLSVQCKMLYVIVQLKVAMMSFPWGGCPATGHSTDIDNSSLQDAHISCFIQTITSATYTLAKLNTLPNIPVIASVVLLIQVVLWCRAVSYFASTALPRTYYLVNHWTIF